MSEKIESRKDVRNVAVVFGNYVINTPILLFAIFVAYSILVGIITFNNPIPEIFGNNAKGECTGWFVFYCAIEIIAWAVYSFIYFMASYESNSTEKDVKSILIFDIANKKDEEDVNKIKVSWKKLVWLIIAVLVIFSGYKATKYSLTEGVAVYNEQKDIRNTYEQKVQERNIMMSEFMDCLTSSLKVSETNANYFKENIQSIMENHKDGDKLMWKWVTEVNPNANFNEVSEMFQHMQLLYLEKRSSIIAINKTLFELEKRDANLRTMFPSNMIINLVGETEPLIRK